MNALVKELKNLNEDFEWYPTTNGMMNCISKDIENQKKINNIYTRDILDCGAGDGRVAARIGNGTIYCIEKSQRLIKEMPEHMIIVGTDFFQSTLIDKEVGCVFSNPPYSEYELWAEKIILEANAKLVYLIIPSRWKICKKIDNAIKLRKASSKIIDSFDFLKAERTARAKVDIVRIDLTASNNSYPCDNQKVDPFDLWFEQNFKPSADVKKEYDHNKIKRRANTLKEKLSNQMTIGTGVVPALVELYNHEMQHLQEVFLTICKLDNSILGELGVSIENIKTALKQRISGLKNKYWKELFSNYERITKRLTHASRNSLLTTLTSHTDIDFTENNVYAVTIWVIKNANKYYDTQLVRHVEKMICESNTILYKSNKRVFTNQDWRYCQKPKNYSHFGLELRIILSNIGGIVPDSWNFDGIKGLDNRAHFFLDDTITIANNLGFTMPEWVNSRQTTNYWISNKKQDFYQNRMNNKLLMTVKAFKNGNLHIKFNQEFIKKLNVEFGRLKGWLTNHIQASEELDIPVAETEKYFKGNYQLPATEGLLLLKNKTNRNHNENHMPG